MDIELTYTYFLAIIIIALVLMVVAIKRHGRHQKILTVEPYSKKRIQLVGKVTGLPRWWAVLKFGFWDLWLTWNDYEVWNPVKIIPKEASYEAAMEMCLDFIEINDVIFLIPGWEKSSGAIKEFNAALTNKKIIMKWYKIIRY